MIGKAHQMDIIFKPLLFYPLLNFLKHIAITIYFPDKIRCLFCQSGCGIYKKIHSFFFGKAASCQNFTAI